MSEAKGADKDKGLHFGPDGSARPLTPRAIAAHSQSRNSFARIVVLGGLLALLTGALFYALDKRPENVKDILLVIMSMAAYLAGSGEFSRRDEK